LNVVSDEDSAEKAKELERLMDRANKQINEVKNTLKSM
jgi:hypothetical protein